MFFLQTQIYCNEYTPIPALQNDKQEESSLSQFLKANIFITFKITKLSILTARLHQVSNSPCHVSPHSTYLSKVTYAWEMLGVDILLFQKNLRDDCFR